MERDASIEVTNLWNRFKKVRRAIHGGITGKANPDISRDLSTFSWSGADSGIHDHSGRLNGIVQGIELDLSIKGVTIDDNPEFEIDADGEWKLTHKTKHDVTMSGRYIFSDGHDGLLDIHFKDGKTYYEAYWLDYLNTHYQLEQIITPGGRVIDATKLQEKRRNEVEIPGTNIPLKRLIKKKS